MGRRLELTKFRNLSIDDPFFDSLKAGYDEFPRWFAGKADEELYVVRDDENNSLSGMIYLKEENGPVEDVEPNLPDLHWLKVGTLKIDGKGTRLGERVIKKIFDTAIDRGCDGIYVTVFELHDKLIKLFTKYGFVRSGTKATDNGIELVFTRSLTTTVGDRTRDYPFITLANHKAWLLAIYPEYHTELLPDSILHNEDADMVRDVSHTNTIHKVYISKLALSRLSPGDTVIFYRTNDHKGPAYYRSVITSVCVVEEVRKKRDFRDGQDFIDYALPRSVFPEEELRGYWAAWSRLYVAKLTYNAALSKRITRGRLMDDGIVTEQPRWDLRELTHDQLRSMLELGEVNARIIVD
ncbi:GNAT family N-acetyltransferase [Aureimonas sp. AU12]|uniref:GNAT family N-acetyltransferase n=1 Tax=Aureimonas sp. AU12 TaxID=1638161 RepID=UPI000781CB1D|nr:GNAT family N-acetyltransferase [Aureimonas sp. AU12]